MFRRSANDKSSGSSAPPRLDQAFDAFAALPILTSREAFLAALLRVIDVAQRAALAEPRAYALLAAAHLTAARACRAGTLPSDVEARCVAFAAAAIARSSGEQQAGSTQAPVDRIVHERFRVLRGRVRGSVFTPRDVEYAFAGDTRAVEQTALSPDRSQALRKLIDEGIAKALTERAISARGGADRLKLRSTIEKAARADQLQIDWEDEDLVFIRAVVEQRPIRESD